MNGSRLPAGLRAQRAAQHELAVRLKVALWRQREPRLTLREAARRLNAADFRTFAGKQWTRGRLAQAVRQRVNPRTEPDAASIAGALCWISNLEKREAA